MNLRAGCRATNKMVQSGVSSSERWILDAPRRAAGWVEFRHEHVTIETCVTAGRLETASGNRKIGGISNPGDVSIPRPIHGDPIYTIRAAPSQICGIRQHRVDNECPFFIVVSD